MSSGCQGSQLGILILQFVTITHEIKKVRSCVSAAIALGQKQSLQPTGHKSSLHL